MTEWMVFFRRPEATPLVFNLITAPDLSVATELGAELAARNRYEFIGAAPFPQPDKGGR